MAANSRFAVAVHTAAVLAARDDAFVSSERIAESVRTNPVVIRRTLAALARAGLVETRLGAGGGARLARPPEEISLLALYEAVEDGGLLAFNPNPPNPGCALSCRMRAALSPVFGAVDDAVSGALGGATLATVLARL